MSESSSDARRIVVIGAGYAGVWAAIAAVDEAAGTAEAAPGAETPQPGTSVTVIARDDHLVARPRLYESDLSAARIDLRPVFEPRGVELVIGEVVRVDPAARSVHLRDGSTVGYDALVLAAGSALAPADWTRGAVVHTIDTHTEAAALQAHLAQEPGPVVIVGAGLAGIELATELAATHSVTLVDAGDLGHLGGAEHHVLEVLADLGVGLRCGRRVVAARDGVVELSDGTAVAAATIVSTSGLRSSPLVADLTDQLDASGRAVVGATLAVAPHVYVAGDVAHVEAQPGHVAPMSCQCAMPMGTVAGRNAVRGLAGRDLDTFAMERYVTCIDLGAAGAVLTVGWERTLQVDGAAAKQIKRRIVEDLIVPRAPSPVG